MLRSPSPRRLAFVLAGALVALAVGMYVTLRPGWQEVTSSLLRAPDHMAEDRGTIWHAEPARVPPYDGDWRWDRHIRDYIPLAPCEARNAFLGRAPHEVEVLNVLPEGRVILRGREYDLTDDGSETEDVLRALGAELDRRPAESPSAVGIVVNGDCRASWRVMRPLLPLIRERTWAREPMGWQVARPPYGRFLELRAVLAPLDAGRPHSDGLALTVSRIDRGSVSVRLAELTFHFPVGCLPGTRNAHEEMELLACNEVWLQVENRLAQVLAGQRAVLTTGADASTVPLAYIITLFDLLIGQRIFDVDLPDEGLALRLLPPPASLDEQVPPRPGAGSRVPLVDLRLTLAGMAAALHVSLRRG